MYYFFKAKRDKKAKKNWLLMICETEIAIKKNN